MRISDWSSDVCSSDLNAAEQAWNDAFAKYAAAHPELAAEFKRRLAGELPADWAEKSQAYIAKLQAEGPEEIGRASCRGRVRQYVSISVVAVSLQKKKQSHTSTHNDEKTHKKKY